MQKIKNENGWPSRSAFLERKASSPYRYIREERQPISPVPLKKHPSSRHLVLIAEKIAHREVAEKEVSDEKVHPDKNVEVTQG